MAAPPSVTAPIPSSPPSKIVSNWSTYSRLHSGQPIDVVDTLPFDLDLAMQNVPEKDGEPLPTDPVLLRCIRMDGLWSFLEIPLVMGRPVNGNKKIIKKTTWDHSGDCGVRIFLRCFH